jgi:hypothetical protein
VLIELIFVYFSHDIPRTKPVCAKGSQVPPSESDSEHFRTQADSCLCIMQCLTWNEGTLLKCSMKAVSFSCNFVGLHYTISIQKISAIYVFVIPGSCYGALFIMC